MLHTYNQIMQKMLLRKFRAFVSQEVGCISLIWIQTGRTMVKITDFIISDGERQLQSTVCTEVCCRVNTFLENACVSLRISWIYLGDNLKHTDAQHYLKQISPSPLPRKTEPAVVAPSWGQPQLGLRSTATHAARDNPLAAQSCSQLRKTEDKVFFNPCHFLAFRQFPEGYRQAFIPLCPFCSICVKKPNALTYSQKRRKELSTRPVQHKR